MDDWISLKLNKNKANGQMYLQLKKKQLSPELKRKFECFKDVKVRKEDFLFD